MPRLATEENVWKVVNYTRLPFGIVLKVMSALDHVLGNNER